METQSSREWTCPRCGTVFGAHERRSPVRAVDPRSPMERLLDHAQGRHDLSEDELRQLLASRKPECH